MNSGAQAERGEQEAQAAAAAAPRTAGTFMRDYHLLVPNMLVRMANTMSTAALPLLLVSLSFPATKVGYIVSFGGFTAMLMNFVGGAISDYSSKRKLMLAGIVGVGASTSLLGMASMAYQFIALRLTQGFATGVFRPTSQALAYEVNPSRRAYILGLLGSTYVLGNAAGPAVAGIVADHATLRVSMFVAGGLATFAALYVAFVYDSLPDPKRTKKAFRAQLSAVLKRNPNQTAVPLLVVMCDAWILNSWHVYLPLYLKKYLHASYTQIGLFIGIESAVYVLAQPYAGRLIDRLGVKIPLVIAMIGHGACVALVPLFNNSAWVLGCLVLMGILDSAANPASVLLSAKLSREEDRGLSLGLLSSASNFGQFLGPIIAGSIIAASDNEAYALTACLLPGLLGALSPLMLSDNYALTRSPAVASGTQKDDSHE
jgi:DHA1 family multidrug resistance protein-like MFS transporter